MAKYVDDVLKLLGEMRRGARWDPTNKTFIWSQDNFIADCNRDLEEMTMEQVAAMASSILNCLNFTWDAPSLHPGREMPVLDTVMWLGIPQRK